MKRFLISTEALVQVLVAMLIVGACSANTTPTIDPADLQNTAIATAFTAFAETQAAIPTNTPPPTEPPTNTPVPTNTFVPLPTEGAASTPLPGGNSDAGDPCVNNPLPNILKGQTIRIRIDNPTKATIMISVNLHPGNPQGVCGYRGYTLVAGDSLVITDLVEGCYTLWAWNPEPKDYFIVTNGTSCLDSSQNWTFDILPGSIRLRE